MPSWSADGITNMTRIPGLKKNQELEFHLVFPLPAAASGQTTGLTCMCIVNRRERAHTRHHLFPGTVRRMRRNKNKSTPDWTDCVVMKRSYDVRAVTCSEGWQTRRSLKGTDGGRTDGLFKWWRRRRRRRLLREFSAMCFVHDSVQLRTTRPAEGIVSLSSVFGSNRCPISKFSPRAEQIDKDVNFFDTSPSARSTGFPNKLK